MSLRKMAIGGVMYDVVTEEEYYRNPQLYTQFTAIINAGSVYPIRRIENRPGAKHLPGFYPTDAIGFYIHPTESTAGEYSDSHMIDFRAAEDMREYIQTKQRLASAERSILTSIDNVFTPEICENDTPEMVALKQAIIDKNIDLDKYEPRFGPNYNNDKRLLKKPSITFGKLRAMCEALDIKATITFEDSNPDVPNPIGRVITAELTGDAMNVDEEE